MQWTKHVVKSTANIMGLKNEPIFQCTPAVQKDVTKKNNIWNWF